MTQTRRPRRAQPEPEKRRVPILPIIGGLAVVALIATVVLTMGSGVGEFGEVTVTGDTLDRFQGSPGSDAELGAPVPELVGEDFDGSTVEITDDGRPKMLIFLAHWCPVCQREVPVVASWIDQGGKPEAVDVYAIATGTSTTRENYPPSEWLEREGLDVPTVLDSEGFDAARAFGLNAYPFWVLVNADGTVFGRFTGEIAAGDLSLLAEGLTG